MYPFYIFQTDEGTVVPRAMSDSGNSPAADVRPHNYQFNSEAYRYFNVSEDKDNWYGDWLACCDTTGVATNWEHRYTDELLGADYPCVAVQQVGNFDRLVYFISEVINTMSHVNSCATLYGMFLERSTTPIADTNLEAVVYMKESWQLVLPNLRTGRLTDASRMPRGEH
jgi:hypothetical protein